MTDEIQSVCEAFSMQPQYLYVGQMFADKIKVATIQLETINFPINGEPMQYKFYVGRDENGNKLFQMRAEATNVIYKTK